MRKEFLLEFVSSFNSYSEIKSFIKRLKPQSSKDKIVIQSELALSNPKLVYEQILNYMALPTTKDNQRIKSKSKNEIKNFSDVKLNTLMYSFTVIKRLLNEDSN